MDRPLFALSLAIALGAWLGGGAPPSEAWSLLALSAVVLALCLGRSRPWLSACGLLAVALAIGVAAAAAERAAFEAASLKAWLARAPDTPVHLEGRAASDAGERDGRTTFLLDVASVGVGSRKERLNGRVRVAIAGEARPPEIIEGDRVALWAAVWRPQGFGNPGSPDPEEAARQEGTHAAGYCKSGLLVEAQRDAAASWDARIAGWRAAIRWRLEQVVPQGQEQAVVKAMVLGDRTALDRETADAFRIAGTYHVLALSGAQVALVAALVLAALRRADVAPAPTALAVSLLLVLYAALVGGQVPVVRATLLAVVVLLGRSLDLDSDLVNLLGLAAALLLVARPSDVADLGFQLSFVATLGLLVLEPPLRGLLPRLPWRLDLALSASLGAQLALTPLLALHFHRVAPAALLLNLVAVPLATAVLLLGAAAAAAAALVPALGQLLGLLAFGAARALLASGTLVRGVPWLDARVPTPATLLVLAHLGALVFLWRGSRARLATGLAAVTGILFVTGLPHWPSDSGLFELTVLDVGQGDALVLRSPHGRVWLVDAGGSYDDRFDVGERVLGPYLWDRNVRRLDGVLLSHPHPDHVGGVPFLVGAFHVGEVWESVAPRHDRGYAVLDEALRKARVPRRSVSRGVTLDWDGVRFEVLGPRPQGPPPATTRNDDSVVLAVSFGATRFLLTGDIEATGESALRLAPVAVLKVPHHGSRTSSSPEFLKAAAPRVALISVGRRSLFGHPHPEVLERYRAAGIRVFRTDRDGAITVRSDGHSVSLRTEQGGEQGVQ